MKKINLTLAVLACVTVSESFASVALRRFGIRLPVVAVAIRSPKISVNTLGSFRLSHGHKSDHRIYAYPVSSVVGRLLEVIGNGKGNKEQLAYDLGKVYNHDLPLARAQRDLMERLEELVTLRSTFSNYLNQTDTTKLMLEKFEAEQKAIVAVQDRIVQVEDYHKQREILALENLNATLKKLVKSN